MRKRVYEYMLRNGEQLSRAQNREQREFTVNGTVNRARSKVDTILSELPLSRIQIRRSKQRFAGQSDAGDRQG